MSKYGASRACVFRCEWQLCKLVDLSVHVSLTVACLRWKLITIYNICLCHFRRFWFQIILNLKWNCCLVIFFQMLQSQLAVQAAAGVNGVLDMFVESNQTNGLRSHSPSSPPQRKRGRPRMDECDKRPRKSYVSRIWPKQLWKRKTIEGMGDDPKVANFFNFMDIFKEKHRQCE